MKCSKYEHMTMKCSEYEHMTMKCLKYEHMTMKCSEYEHMTIKCMSSEKEITKKNFSFSCFEEIIQRKNTAMRISRFQNLHTFFKFP